MLCGHAPGNEAPSCAPPDSALGYVYSAAPTTSNLVLLGHVRFPLRLDQCTTSLTPTPSLSLSHHQRHLRHAEGADLPLLAHQPPTLCVCLYGTLLPSLLAMRLPSALVAATTAAAVVATLTVACPGIDHDHGQGLGRGRGLGPRSQFGSTQPSGGRSYVRPVTWGQITVVHTTDIHGWYQGHLHATQPEPNYSGDWGDFASFVTHLRAQARHKGVDLLVVDSGDLHDGAGFSDGPPAGQVAGRTADDFHLMVD